jgi:hypothetical protein
MRVSSSSEDFMLSRGNYFLFGLVFIKKITKLNFFLKKTKIGSNRLVSVLFGFFRTKTGLAWFFPVWLGFLPVWVWFGFFSFRLIKPKPN